MKKEKYKMAGYNRLNAISPGVFIWGVLCVLLIITAICADSLAPYDAYQQNLSEALMPPSALHIAGTDQYGRDVLSRVIAGARLSVLSSLFVVVLITFAGSAMGIICGYCGGVVDNILMRIADIFLAFPGIVFAIAVASVLSGGITSAVIAVAAVSWPKYARLARSEVLSVCASDYIKAARMSGLSEGRIIIKHIIPNIAGIIVTTALLDIGHMMMEIAGLSFLGLGAASPAAEWGAMMSNGRSMLQTAPWVILAPGAAIFVSVLIFNMFGESVKTRRNKNNRRTVYAGRQ